MCPVFTWSSMASIHIPWRHPGSGSGWLSCTQGCSFVKTGLCLSEHRQGVVANCPEKKQGDWTGCWFGQFSLWRKNLVSKFTMLVHRKLLLGLNLAPQLQIWCWSRLSTNEWPRKMAPAVRRVWRLERCHIRTSSALASCWIWRSAKAAFEIDFHFGAPPCQYFLSSSKSLGHLVSLGRILSSQRRSECKQWSQLSLYEELLPFPANEKDDWRTKDDPWRCEISDAAFRSDICIGLGGGSTFGDSKE